MGPRPKPVRERLMAGVVVTDTGCWAFRPQSSGPNGYRQISIGQVNGRSVAQFAHRVSYEIHVGPIPAGLQLDHLCRNRICVNPEHLEPVTAQENSRRAKAVIDACPLGHPYDSENTGLYRGHRYCKECNRTRALARWRAKNPPKPKPTHCPKGHEFTPENTKDRSAEGRGRECRACSRIRTAEWKRKRAAEKENIA